jgi:P4 family phage/plasmid primase-like protien
MTVELLPDEFEEIDLESISPSSPGGNGKGRSLTTPTSADLAEWYLAARDGAICFWNGAFYCRMGGRHYEEVSASDLAADVIRWLQGTANRKSAGTRAAGEILANVKAITFIPSNVEPPFLICTEGPEPAPRSLIPMANGNFNVEKYLAGEDDALTPHTADLFSLSSLPFPLIPGAECPTFNEVLKQNLPDPEYRAFLQEWIGLNLVPDSTFEAFMIYTGEAGTGKTVTCTVQSTLLGPASVSAIPLEAFNPVRTFPLAALVGKLANIAEEIGECDKAAEGLLKQLVTGSPVTIERKYGDPFQLRNRARLTFATNVLPRFADRSNGIWRRMLILPFSQVVPEEKRNRRYLDPEWWIASGELPGVFLWALEGLRRLRARGRFNEPIECRVIREEYKRDSNPAGVFLLDNCTADITATTPGNVLFKAYSAHVKEQGQHPLSEPMFAREVKRLFPLVDKQKNPTWQPDGTKTRLWMGLRFNGRTP